MARVPFLRFTAMKNIQDIDVKRKRVLLRCDFNVPLSEDGKMLDDLKIQQALPTLQHLIKEGAKIIIITHLGDGHEKLDTIAQRLSELLGKPIKKIDGFDVPDDQIVMLENIRSHQGEIDNSEEFAEQLASLGDIYINEAFDVCHRAHASVVALPALLPHAAGLLLQKEVAVLSSIMQNPKRPMVAIIGGAKASTKAVFVNSFCAFADLVIVNGLIKQELIDKKIFLEYPEKVVGPKQDLQGLDISAEDAARLTGKILQAKTVVWNGPFGKFEDAEYVVGTQAIANAIIESGAFSVVGGGQTVAFLHKEGIMTQFNHVSTAGGAMLEFLSGQELPGLKALEP